jgi:hypothetical protein
LKVKFAGFGSFPVALGPATRVAKLFMCFPSFTCHTHTVLNKTLMCNWHAIVCAPIRTPVARAQVTRDSQHASLAPCCGNLVRQVKKHLALLPNLFSDAFLAAYAA